MADEKKLISIEGKGNFSVNKEAFRQFKKGFATQCEFIPMMAKLTRIKFDALKEQGFSAAEALELSKNLF